MAHKPLREGTPLPFVITHWINLLAMLFLTLSGFYIHFPLFGGWMGVARGTHFFWMFVLIINLVIRIILAFFVKSATELESRKKDYDWKNWVGQESNKHQMWPVIKYYLFFKKDYPITAKYASLQKIAYWATVPITFLAAYTGFCLWAPTAQWGIFQAGTDLIADLFGSGGGALMPMRIVHYWIMWVVLIFTAVHAYLANIYNFAPSKMIFAWIEEPDAHVKEEA
jgi:Ni/Fe-hydrogenase 1 B-type cytochrome subunit